jgi:hypothetical protein
MKMSGRNSIGTRIANIPRAYRHWPTNVSAMKLLFSTVIIKFNERIALKKPYHSRGVRSATTISLIKSKLDFPIEVKHMPPGCPAKILHIAAPPKSII